jgi:hypothetical protein
MLVALKVGNLALAFLLELAVLAAVGYWGFTVRPALGIRLLAGIGTPALFIAIWAIFGAPKAPVQLKGVVRIAFGIVWFGAGAAALVAAGRWTWGVVLASLYAFNAILVRVWHR